MSLFAKDKSCQEKILQTLGWGKHCLTKKMIKFVFFSLRSLKASKDNVCDIKCHTNKAISIFLGEKKNICGYKGFIFQGSDQRKTLE
jgi:hypothetical protein